MLKLNDLRRIIKEELSVLSEQVDHVAVRDIVNGASKLLAAVEAFKKTSSPAALNAVTPHIDKIERVLEDMVNTPGSYVSKPKLEPKKVSLKSSKSESVSYADAKHAYENPGSECEDCGTLCEPQADSVGPEFHYVCPECGHDWESLGFSTITGELRYIPM